MPLQIPILDDRKYQDLLDEALARIPVHNPEWTNFNDSDPGVTLVQLFAFMTETLLYRSNQIPERNRRKFLQLLDIPLRAASSAQGLISFTNERGPMRTLTLNQDVEVRAGQVPFRTQRALDVLPVETRVYYKRRLENPPSQLVDYYKQLYISFIGSPPRAEPLLYETIALPPDSGPQFSGIDLAGDTVDGSLWIALLARPNTDLARIRTEIAGKTISLGVVPAVENAPRRLAPTGQANPESETLLQYQIPKLPNDTGWSLPTDPAKIEQRVPRYTSLEARTHSDVLAQPGIVELTLPSEARMLELWDNLDPLEMGAGDFPPALEDTNLADRVITWVRVRIPANRLEAIRASPVRAKLLWIGINTVPVTQRTHVTNELLPRGTGEPDQVRVLSKTPVIPHSVRLTVMHRDKEEQWIEIDDLLSAGAEVQVRDPRLPPGTTTPPSRRSQVFTVDQESGEIRFGDGTRGTRLPFNAILRADYDYGAGRDGNVGVGAINTGPALPAGIKVSNPIPTWGGDEAETVREGEKQIARYLQHRDRLVNAEDFKAITLRTPGVDLGRVEVIPAFNPELTPNEPGDAPGAVTLMVIPRYDPVQPDAPVPDRLFLDTICSYLDPRRLVTTEVFLRGPIYKPIWISIGINVIAGAEPSLVREAVKQELRAFLSPLPRVQPPAFDDAEHTAPSLISMATGNSVQPPGVDTIRSLFESRTPHADQGWPLRKPVVALELWAVASRVQRVSLINNVVLAEGSKAPAPQVPMVGLELPRVAGIAVAIGDPLDLDQLRSQTLDVSALNQPDAGTKVSVVPVPVVPEECR